MFLGKHFLFGVFLIELNMGIFNLGCLIGFKYGEYLI
jgi:hypothetical protein